jgi:hypothetical protein
MSSVPITNQDLDPDPDFISGRVSLGLLGSLGLAWDGDGWEYASLFVGILHLDNKNKPSPADRDRPLPRMRTHAPRTGTSPPVSASATGTSTQR